MEETRQTEAVKQANDPREGQDERNRQERDCFLHEIWTDTRQLQT